jgi:hypothetical protein
VIALDASLLIAHFDAADAHHGGARVNRGTQMLADLQSIGLRLAPRDDGEPLRLAVLRVDTGLTLPDCCVLDNALSNGATLATFDGRLARAAARLDVRVMPMP